MGRELVANDSCGLAWLPVPAVSSLLALLCQQMLAVGMLELSWVPGLPESQK